MPKVKRNIGRHTRNTRNQRIIRTNRHASQEISIIIASQNEVEQVQAEINSSANIRNQNHLNNQEGRPISSNALDRMAFRYDPTKDYSAVSSVDIGSMTVVCQYCKALKYPKETNGFCCASGKIKLPVLNPPPEPLHKLLSGADTESKHFLKNITLYNNCFQMTSFGATNIVRDNFMPTFKVN